MTVATRNQSRHAHTRAELEAHIQRCGRCTHALAFQDSGLMCPEGREHFTVHELAAAKLAAEEAQEDPQDG